MEFCHWATRPYLCTGHFVLWPCKWNTIFTIWAWSGTQMVEFPRTGLAYLYTPKNWTSELAILFLFSVNWEKLAPSERKLCGLCQTSTLRRDQLPSGNAYFSWLNTKGPCCDWLRHSTFRWLKAGKMNCILTSKEICIQWDQDRSLYLDISSILNHAKCFPNHSDE